MRVCAAAKPASSPRQAPRSQSLRRTAVRDDPKGVSDAGDEAFASAASPGVLALSSFPLPRVSASRRSGDATRHCRTTVATCGICDVGLGAQLASAPPGRGLRLRVPTRHRVEHRRKGQGIMGVRKRAMRGMVKMRGERRMRGRRSDSGHCALPWLSLAARSVRLSAASASPIVCGRPAGLRVPARLCALRLDRPGARRGPHLSRNASYRGQQSGVRAVEFSGGDGLQIRARRIVSVGQQTACVQIKSPPRLVDALRRALFKTSAAAAEAASNRALTTAAFARVKRKSRRPSGGRLAAAADSS